MGYIHLQIPQTSKHEQSVIERPFSSAFSVRDQQYYCDSQIKAHPSDCPNSDSLSRSQVL